jgi:RimJ/RimL family protein N-acetyltransferase
VSNTILETKRLRLRYQEPDDTMFIVDLWTDENMAAYTGGPRDRNFMIEEVTKSSKKPRKEEYDLWMIELIESGKLIGQAGFIPKTIENEQYIELNYYIVKDKWGNGYATEIGRALLKHAFEIKKVKTVVAIIDPKNLSSKVVAEKIGMKYWKNEIRSEEKDKMIYRIEKKVSGSVNL